MYILIVNRIEKFEDGGEGCSWRPEDDGNLFKDACQKAKQLSLQKDVLNVDIEKVKITASEEIKNLGNICHYRNGKRYWGASIIIKK
jgi:hypothetical protein